MAVCLSAVIFTASQVTRAAEVTGGGLKKGDPRWYFVQSPTNTYILEAYAKGPGGGAVADFDTTSGTKPKTGTRQNRVVTSTGATGGAQAQSVIEMRLLGTEITQRDSFARINPDDVKGGRPYWTVEDPWELAQLFSPNQEDSNANLLLESGFGIGAGPGALASYHWDVGVVNRPGYESLFVLDIVVSHGQVPIVSFVSNPLLALSDSTVADTVQNQLVAGYDAVNNKYSLASDLPLFSYTLSGYDYGESVILNFSSRGEVSTVPEPASALTLGAGFLFAIGLGRRSHRLLARAAQQRQQVAEPRP